MSVPFQFPPLDPGMPGAGSTPPTFPTQGSVQPGGPLPASSDKMAQLKQLLDKFKTSMAIPGAQGQRTAGSPVISPAQVLQVGGTNVPQVGTNVSPVKPQSIFSQMPQSPAPQEWATRKGAKAADAYTIANTITGAVRKIEEKKQKGLENEGYMAVSLWYDAMQRGDTASANAIAEKYHDVLKKAFGMKGGLPTFGQQPQGQGAKQGAQKPQPSESKGALRAIMDKIQGKKSDQGQAQGSTQLPTPQMGPAAEAEGRVAGAINTELQKPGASEQQARISMGLEQSPAQIQAQQAVMQQVVTKAVAELEKAQAEIQGKMAVAQAEITGRADVAGVEATSRERAASITAGSRITAAQIQAMGRISAEMAKAQESLKANRIGDSVKSLNSVGASYLDQARLL